MLLKNRISNISMFSDGEFNYDWKKERLGRFTSSNIWKLMGEKGFGDTGMSYIRSRVYESLSGLPSEQEINTEATINGLVEEGPALRAYIFKRGIDPNRVVVQKMIYGSNNMFSSTPDGIYLISGTTDNTAYDVEVWEAKAYGVQKHMECLEADTPQQLKTINRPLYFQVLDQMQNIDCLIGKAILHCPDLKPEQGGQHIIEFNKTQKETDPKTGKPYFPIVDDLRLLDQRKNQAIQEYERIKNKILNRSKSTTNDTK